MTHRLKVRVWTPATVRGARGLLDWTQQRLADGSGLELEAVELFEQSAAELSAFDMHRLATTLRAAGVTIVGSALAGDGVRFRAPGPTAAPDDLHANALRGLKGDMRGQA